MNIIYSILRGIHINSKSLAKGESFLGFRVLIWLAKISKIIFFHNFLVNENVNLMITFFLLLLRTNNSEWEKFSCWHYFWKAFDKYEDEFLIKHVLYLCVCMWERKQEVVNFIKLPPIFTLFFTQFMTFSFTQKKFGK